MNKLTLKVVTDALMFVSLSSTLAVGLIMKLIPTGGGPDAEKYFLHVHRHSWGELHFFLAVIFVASLAAHLILNWGWVSSVAKRYFGENSQKALYALAGAWIGVLFFGWIVLLIA